MGFVVSERMQHFLERLLMHYRFEEMRIPLGVAATDLCATRVEGSRFRRRVYSNPCELLVSWPAFAR